MPFIKHFRMAQKKHEKDMYMKYGPLWKDRQLDIERKRGESLARATQIKTEAVYSLYNTPAN